MKFILLIAAVFPACACNFIEGDRIVGKDLSAANSAFAALDPRLNISATPLAGVQRLIRPEELVRLAKQNDIVLTGPVSPICFERATELLTEETLLPILRQALSIDNAKIEILDFSRFGVPRGTFDFQHSSLAASGLWRGRVLYEQGHSMPVWVKTRITIVRTWVEATVPLIAGKAIETSQLVVKTGPRFPFDPAFLESVDSVTGRRPVRMLSAGTQIAEAMLMIAHDVERGDPVAVEVRVGRAILDFQATADSSGRAGESIMVKNPGNGRSFQAKIQDKGHVVVEK